MGYESEYKCFFFYPFDTYRPRARFDRLYFRPSNQNTKQFKPVYSELEVFEELPGIKRYCSDHYAIQAYFDILSDIFVKRQFIFLFYVDIFYNN
ncbi:unnamed protein product [Rotaria socialis]|nr:unnamed protein product [Rotaria socialis]CAF3391628.1 unnamed protein product [Rotaria socialis]